jgi:type VI protein secretion system component VasF
MDEAARVRSLLEEIRDLQKEQLAEYRAQAARSIRLTEEAVARQKAIGDLYKRVVVVGAILIVALLAGLWWLIGRLL